MKSGHLMRAVAWVLAASLVTVTHAREAEPTAMAPIEESASGSLAERLLLDAVRDDLVGLRFEEALAAIEALLGDPGLSEAGRAEAWVLRSQAHVAFGDLDAAEGDYREILRMHPSFVPDASLTPSKAMERFQRARVALIGDLVLNLQPADARVFVDDRAVTVSPETRIPLLVGEHVVRAEREGFDPLRQTVQIEANHDRRLELRLVPNARTVVLRTEPEGVDVKLDGMWVGRTERPPDDEARGMARRPATLRIESLSLGEHVFELTKTCFRGESLRDLLTVDLLDWSPKTYPLVSLVPVRSIVVLRGGPEGSDVHVDGEHVARLPADSIEVCPGRRRIEVRRGERRVWSHAASLAEAEEAVIEVEPRPNVVLLDEGEWPPGILAFDEGFNSTRGSAPPSGADLGEPEQWDRLRLPRDADLALARRSAGEGESAGWWLYSPVLRVVAPLEAAPETLDPPRWAGVCWGLSVVDSERSGPALVAHVNPDGPAFRAGLRPGDRLISLGGSQVGAADRARRIMEVASASAPLDAEWLSPDGRSHRGRLSGEPTVWLSVEAPTPVAAMVRAAWAVVDAAGDGAQVQAATANLALLLSTYGRHELAARTWRRVALAERTGIGRGTVQYYLGRELEWLGAEEDAIRTLRAAAASRATAFDDEGPRIAPASRDRLADLGVLE
jgi:hypothetical protein